MLVQLMSDEEAGERQRFQVLVHIVMYRPKGQTLYFVKCQNHHD